MGKLFKSKKPRVETKVVEIPEYKKVRQKVANTLLGYIGSPAPKYPYQRIADFTPDEKEYFTKARQWARQSGLSPTYSLAKGEVTKTLTNQYDPTTSLFYKAMRDAALYNLQKSLDRIADFSAGGGRYWTGARARLQQEATTQTTNELNRILGNLAQQERQNRLAVLPYATSIGQYEEMLPLRRASVLQDIGELQRRLAQARLDEMYRQWMFENMQWPQSWLNLGLGMIQGEPISIQNIVRPGRQSLFSKFAGPLATAAGYALGGPIGGMLGGALGKFFGNSTSSSTSSLSSLGHLGGLASLPSVSPYDLQNLYAGIQGG